MKKSIFYDGIPNLLKCNVPINRKKHRTEIKKCQTNIKYFLKNHVKIINQEDGLIPFKIYEYKDAKPIISVIFENNSYEEYSKYLVIRNNPDKIIVNYNFSGSEKILFKETFHFSWKAKNNENTKIKINCLKHGYFYQTPHNHLNSRGCPICNNSKGEKLIRNWLINN